MDDVSQQPTVAASPQHVIPQPEDVADLLPHLEMEEVIGRGGMGIVYRARQRSLDRPVAVKLLPPHPQPAGESDSSFADRFQREARTLARLQHPNIVTIYDSGMTGECFYFVMELVDGINLRRLMKNGPVPLDQVLGVLVPICDALAYAHDRGIVHRDLKPENILINRSGTAKLADFGLAKLLQHPKDAANLTTPDQVMGTMHYMAPEQVEQPMHTDHRADVYAMGVVLYEMLTGELPLGRFPAPSAVAAVPTAFDDLVFDALAKNRDARPESIEALRDRLIDAGAAERRDAPARRPREGAVQQVARDVDDVLQDIDAALKDVTTMETPKAERVNHWSSVPHPPAAPEYRQTGIGYLLLALGLVGLFGIHRFYLGRWGTGLLWFFTGGLFVIGQLVDLALLPGMTERTNARLRGEYGRRAAAPPQRA